MSIVLKIAVGVVSVVMVWDMLTRKYLNPFKLYFIFGAKGAGKTITKRGLEVFEVAFVEFCADFREDKEGVFFRHEVSQLVPVEAPDARDKEFRHVSIDEPALAHILDT